MSHPGPAGLGGARALLSPSPLLHRKPPPSLAATKPSKSHCSQIRSFAGLGGSSSPLVSRPEDLCPRTSVRAPPSTWPPWRGTSPGAACSAVRSDGNREGSSGQAVLSCAQVQRGRDAPRGPTSAPAWCSFPAASLALHALLTISKRCCFC